MLISPTKQEIERVVTFRNYGILERREECFDRLMRLAGTLFCAPISQMSIIGDEWQHKKSFFGKPMPELRREFSFCTHTLHSNEPLIVCDARLDSRFAHNPLVVDFPGVRFYAGVRLRTPEGLAIGAICVLDLVPRPYPDDNLLAALLDLSAEVIAQLTFQRLERELAECRQALESSRMELAQSIEDVTKEQQTLDELELARETAELASRAKDNFLANMSHEFRTPLNGVLGLTDLLLDTRLSGEQIEMVQMVRTEGIALLRMLTDVLDLTRIQSGQLSIRATPFDLEAMVEQAVAAAQEEARRMGLSFVMSGGQRPCRQLVGDSGRIRQIVGHFLGNAIKFASAGQISIKLEVQPVNSCYANIVISVSDQGKGIPSEVLSRLFLPFSQADTSSTRRHGGIGIGLATCRRLAELMGGSMGASSVVGGGSTFWLRLQLPFASSAACVEAPSA